MRVRIRMVAVMLCLLMVAFGFGGPGGALATASQRDLDAKLNELDSVNERLDRAREQLVRYGKEEKDAMKALQNAENKLATIERQMAQTDKDLKAAEEGLVRAERELVLAETELTKLTKNYDATLEGLEARLISIYKMGPSSYLELLLGSESFADFVTRYDFLRLIIAQNATDLEGLKQAKSDLEAQRVSISARKTELELKKRNIATLAQNLTKQRAESEKLAAEREYYLGKVTAEKAKWQKELEEEERQSRELEKTIRDLQNSLIKSGGTPVWTGGFIWPVTGRISSSFGWRVHPIFKDRRYHSGIDIAVPTGTSVKAAAGGKVILAGWINGYGNTVIIDHGGGLSTLYGHNSKLNTAAGKAVMQGDIISKAGSTGFATGPHVHFEVRVNGTAEDPMKRLPK
ncbi:MAG: Murein hydrolase activator EnvC precursor [Firmicutes bacterium ADurb.Bin506]|jgi:murein DD-endopeptidase MepM/ murein hydrolase activator NlpD|nr:MAG: Murein hydrolase activator EnvC precursor [Firmicutes bacterium ADurb.Bin506]